ncbi:MAG: TrkA family potassium uptake protein [Bacteroidales bacterium]|nr:MAG: TrkA family potassium uptake protein [Bacteroidales bacterium]
MKYIIIGLGNFGASIAEKLTLLGNEVIGVDNNMEKVDAIKDKITHSICLNSIDSKAVMSLPFKNTDVVFVCIGEDEGANILVSALMKKMKVKRLISRSVSPLHETVLEAMGIEEIVNPEVESAERWVKKLTSKGLVDSFELTKKYSIVEAVVPEQFIGKTVEQIGIRRNFNVIILTTIKHTTEKNLIGVPRSVPRIQEVAHGSTILSEGDVMVLYGSNEDIHRLLKE